MIQYNSFEFTHMCYQRDNFDDNFPSHFSFNSCQHALHGVYEGFKRYGTAFAWLWLINSLLTAGAFGMVWYQPWSNGSGIPETKCVLNGVSIPQASTTTAIAISRSLCRATTCRREGGGILISSRTYGCKRRTSYRHRSGRPYNGKGKGKTKV